MRSRSNSKSKTDVWGVRNRYQSAESKTVPREILMCMKQGQSCCADAACANIRL
ncbi:unnamed protein product [Chondrus crispus]|uniref:Uncharacterized protein n=1 Tax=Chondrus crispus TaxID=2769 RepID=R7Q431_CHOCR|nr:unnamed protein product [Chondrus crispus]CDF33287.1 unnamed protein product [Chondrus crispus]|eukprot:XP_005713090.1 unnamed protein product [Chondrus crispus]